MLGDMISCFTLQQQALGLCSCNGRLYFDKILPVLNVSNIFNHFRHKNESRSLLRLSGIFH